MTGASTDTYHADTALSCLSCTLPVQAVLLQQSVFALTGPFRARAMTVTGTINTSAVLIKATTNSNVHYLLVFVVPHISDQQLHRCRKLSTVF